MEHLEQGASPSKRREGRLSLQDQRPPFVSSHASAEPLLNSKITGPAQQFEAALWDARNRWSIHRLNSLNGALAGRGKLTAADADKLLRQPLAALDGEALDRSPNALANYRRVGAQ